MHWTETPLFFYDFTKPFFFTNFIFNIYAWMRAKFTSIKQDKQKFKTMQ